MEFRTDNNDPRRFWIDGILVDYNHFMDWARIGQYKNQSGFSGCISHRVGQIAFTLLSTAESLAGAGYKTDTYEYKPNADYVMRCLKELAGFGYNLLP